MDRFEAEANLLREGLGPKFSGEMDDLWVIIQRLREKRAPAVLDQVAIAAAEEAREVQDIIRKQVATNIDRGFPEALGLSVKDYKRGFTFKGPLPKPGNKNVRTILVVDPRVGLREKPNDRLALNLNLVGIENNLTLQTDLKGIRSPFEKPYIVILDDPEERKKHDAAGAIRNKPSDIVAASFLEIAQFALHYPEAFIRREEGKEPILRGYDAADVESYHNSGQRAFIAARGEGMLVAKLIPDRGHRYGPLYRWRQIIPFTPSVGAS